MEFKLSTPLVLIIGGANVNEQQSSAMPDQRLRGLARLVRTLTKLLVKTDKFYMHPLPSFVPLGFAQRGFPLRQDAGDKVTQCNFCA
jgi:hypothetical protein